MKRLSQYIKESLLDDEDNIVNTDYIDQIFNKYKAGKVTPDDIFKGLYSFKNDNKIPHLHNVIIWCTVSGLTLRSIVHIAFAESKDKPIVTYELYYDYQDSTYKICRDDYYFNELKLHVKASNGWFEISDKDIRKKLADTIDKYNICESLLDDEEKIINTEVIPFNKLSEGDIIYDIYFAKDIAPHIERLHVTELDKHLYTICIYTKEKQNYPFSITNYDIKKATIIISDFPFNKVAITTSAVEAQRLLDEFTEQYNKIGESLLDDENSIIKKDISIDGIIKGLIEDKINFNYYKDLFKQWCEINAERYKENYITRNLDGKAFIAIGNKGIYMTLMTEPDNYLNIDINTIRGCRYDKVYPNLEMHSLNYFKLFCMSNKDFNSKFARAINKYVPELF